MRGKRTFARSPAAKSPVFASRSHATVVFDHSRVPPYIHAASTMFARNNQRAAASGSSVGDMRCGIKLPP